MLEKSKFAKLSTHLSFLLATHYLNVNLFYENDSKRNNKAVKEKMFTMKINNNR